MDLFLHTCIRFSGDGSAVEEAKETKESNIENLGDPEIFETGPDPAIADSSVGKFLSIPLCVHRFLCLVPVYTFSGDGSGQPTVEESVGPVDPAVNALPPEKTNEEIIPGK